ncbi:phage tail protein [Marinococcus halophilus]|uniref:phage tail protein n=1 Tax=Marinococcus halophilus TaxID=1371 RepID=UPI0009A7C955|nr:phage tail protein [Marinococcus halophilus]
MDSPTLYVMNAAGEQFPAMAETTVTDGLNEDKTLSTLFVENEVNEAFIGDLDKTWYVGGVEGPADDKLWKVTIPRLRSSGERRVVSVQARLKFIDDMDNDRIYERYDESMTAARFFTLLFDGTPYTFQFQGSFASQSWEGLFDGESRLESFQRGLERYEMEYELLGNQVYLHPRIEREQPYIMHRRLNASDIEKEEDASEFWTYARGFGDYEGEADSGENGGVTERANLVREYESPLAKVVGRRHAPPVKNGNITQVATMDEALKNVVEQSVKVAITNEFHVLKGYPYAKPENGDVITVIDDVLQYEAQTRVTKIETVRDAVGKILSQKVTNGGQNISERQKAQLNAAGKFISDLQKGRKTIPFNFQDGASKLATNLLLAARTEVDFTTQGLVLTDKSNPNLVTLVNSAGIGISEDGGQTFRDALTGAGLVADVVTSGTLNTHLARIMGTDGIFIIDGDELFSVDPDNPDKFVRITPGNILVRGGGATFLRPDGYAFLVDGIARQNMLVDIQRVYPNGTEFDGYRNVSTQQVIKDVARLHFKHDFRYLHVYVSHSSEYSQTECIMTIEPLGFGEPLAELRTNNVDQTDYANAESVIVVDLGVPDGSRRSLWLRFRSSSGNFVKCACIGAWGNG